MNVIVVTLLVAAIHGGADESAKPEYNRFVIPGQITQFEFEQLLKDGAHFFIALVTGNCPHCDELVAKVEEINNALKKIKSSLEMHVLDIDFLANKAIKDSMKVSSFPAIYLYLGDADGIYFDKERTPDKMVEFYQRVSSATVTAVENEEDLEMFKDSAYAAVLFVIDEKLRKNHRINHIARENYNVHIGYTMKNSEISNKFKQWINVFRNGELQTSSLPKRNDEEIDKFVKVQTHPPVYHFPSDSYSLTGLHEDNYLFYIDDLAGVVEATPWLKKIGDKRRGSFVVLLCDYSDPTAERALKYFGVIEGDPARVRLVVRSSDLHFKMEEDTADPVSEQTVIAWLEKFEKGDLVPFLKSQLLPVDWNKEPLKILVGSNYAEVVSDVSKHVFVLLYIPENRRNDYAVEQFAKLAELFLDFDDVVIAKIDMNSNDIPHQYLRVGRLPAARFYPKGEKKELEYSNRPVLADVKDFVEKHTGYVTKFDETAASQSQETEREQSHGEL